MCGIVGMISTQAVALPMLGALKRLEYRGYDSAGLATLEGGRLTRRRASGKLCNLEDKLSRQPLRGSIGIGHTRWATHGRPSEKNAHPHASKNIALVHNGIIENYRTLRDDLVSKGEKFESETDSEVIVHLVEREFRSGKSPFEAVQSAVRQLHGAFALALIFEGEQDLLIAARRNSPLAIGHGTDEMYVGSDAIALAPFTDAITYMDDGDVAEISRRQIRIVNDAGKQVFRPMNRTTVSSGEISKGQHKHFMAKEIAEQPDVVRQTLAQYIDKASDRINEIAFPFDCEAIGRITIAGCGTAYYAGMIAKYWFERFGRVSTDAELASELRYRESPLKPGDLAILVSQSGETADTLAALRYAKLAGQHVAGVVNVATSSVARESDLPFLTQAGPEIGVASTKAFTCQLATLAALSIAVGRQRKVLSPTDEQRLVKALADVPSLMTQAIGLEPEIR